MLLQGLLPDWYRPRPKASKIVYYSEQNFLKPDNALPIPQAATFMLVIDTIPLIHIN